MGGWTFAELWEIDADQLPDAPALVQERRRSHLGGARPARRRRRRLAARHRRVREQDKVAQYLYNCPEYLESMFASFKAGLRAGEHQLPLRRRRAALPVGQRRRRRRRVPRHLRRAHRARCATAAEGAGAGCGSTTAPGRARRGPRPTRTRPTATAERQRGPWGRDGDDLYMLYTGGTTGMPKGVMWRQDDLVMLLAAQLGAGFPERPDLEAVRELRTAARARSPSPPARSCTAPVPSSSHGRR